MKRVLFVTFFLAWVASCLEVAAQNPGTVSLISGSTSGCGTVTGRLKVTGNTGIVEGWQEKRGTNGSWEFIWIDGNPPKKVTSATYDFMAIGPSAFRFAVKPTVVSTNYVYSNEITISVSPAPKGGTTSGEAKHYVSGSGTIQLTGYTGQIVNWQQSVNGGSAWTDLSSTSASYAYTNVTRTTGFRAVLQNGTCVGYSTMTTITVDQTGVITGPATGTDETAITVNLQGSDGAVKQWEHSIDGGNTWISHPDLLRKVSFNYTMREETKFRAQVTMGDGLLYYTPVKTVAWIPYSQGNPVSGVLGQNYVRTQQPNVNVTDLDAVDALPNASKHEGIVYLDGQGRMVQQVSKAGSTSSKDLVSFSVYGANNVSTAYLPYAAQQSDGAYKTDFLSAQATFYANGLADKIADTSFPFAKTVYEQSPLSRILEQGAQGADWQPGAHSVKVHYGQNRVNEVRLFTSAGVSTSFYPANELNMTEFVDGDGNKRQTFTNKLGQVILKRIQLDEAINGSNVPWLETYYIYNASGDIKFIMTPKGVDVKNMGSWATHSAQFMNQYMYQFVYDDLGRLIEKKIPGQAWVYYCYDALDRMVLMQDGYLRDLKKWTYIKYDRRGRPVMQGLYTNSSFTSRATLQQNVLDPLYQTESTKYYEERGTTTHGYTNQTFPTTAAELQIVNYYDDYDFDFNGTNDFEYAPQGLANEGTPFSSTGLLTGSKTLVLGTSNWLYNYLFYDKEGRLIQTLSNNQLSSAIDNRITQVFDFDGKLTTIKKYHNAGAGRTTTVLNKFVYDEQGRISKIYQNNNNAVVDQLAVQYVYNELGQLIDKKLHETATGSGTFIQSVDYRYSIRGWLESINNVQLVNDGSVTNDDAEDYFGMELSYNTPVSNLTASGYFDGKISVARWKGVGKTAGAAGQTSYVYNYDKANRLKSASSKIFDGVAWTTEVGALNESLTYDHNGNVATLKRSGRQYQGPGANAYGTAVIDDLQYTYGSTAGGDQLTRVVDATSNPLGFDNGSSATANDYTYDLRGNLLTDVNKGITGNIVYNQLSKAAKIEYNDGRKIEFIYDATGVKLTAKVYEAGGVLKKTTDYIDGFVYENSALVFFASPEGRVVNKAGVLEYQYTIADHQGNTRVLFSSVNPTQAPATASFEDAVSDSEVFENINTSSMYWVHKTAANNTPGGQYVIRMNNTYTTGPAKQLKVFPGDKVSMEAWAYFEGASGFGGSNQPLNTLITSVANALGGVAGGLGESGLIYDGVNSAYSLFGSPSNKGEDVPTANLNYILFDKDHNVLDMGWRPVTGDANMARQKLSFESIDIQEPGYMYVYLSYDGEGANWVYFDDLKVTHVQTNVLQYNEYYPFGLQTNNSWTRDNSSNSFLYNDGSELNGITGIYETRYRGYDPVLGRFIQVDPLAMLSENESIYSYAGNNPVSSNDPLGLTTRQQMMDAIEDLLNNSANGGMYDPATGMVTEFGSEAAASSWASAYGQQVANGGSGSIVPSVSYEIVPRAATATLVPVVTYKYVEDGPDPRSDVGMYDDLSDAPVNGPDGSNDPWRATKFAAGIAVTTSVADGPIPVGEVVGAAIISGAVAYDLIKQSKDFKYVTYTKTNPTTGQVYVGRTSGYGAVEDIVKQRDYGHHKTKEGYGEAKVSTWAPATIAGGYNFRGADPAYWAIRGSEQLQIEAYRRQGISGNSINGIGPTNQELGKFLDAARRFFGL